MLSNYICYYIIRVIQKRSLSQLLLKLFENLSCSLSLSGRSKCMRILETVSISPLGEVKCLALLWTPLRFQFSDNMKNNSCDATVNLVKTTMEHTYSWDIQEHMWKPVAFLTVYMFSKGLLWIFQSKKKKWPCCHVLLFYLMRQISALLSSSPRLAWQCRSGFSQAIR